MSCRRWKRSEGSVLSIYPMLLATRFTNMASFERSVMDCYNNFVDGSSVHHQYMAFMNVSWRRFNEIDALREGRTSLPRIVVSYNAIEEVLIVKIRPSILHNIASMTFHNIFYEKLLHFGIHEAISFVGSGRFGQANDRCKEGDNAYRPIGRHGDDFPSFVVEVGVSESFQMLRSDARYWLTQSGGQTQIVIIIHIDKPSRTIALERWECHDCRRPRRANISYPFIPRAIQSLTLNSSIQYNGDALVIPVAKVFDIVPNNLPVGEFIFTCIELQDFSQRLWTGI